MLDTILFLQKIYKRYQVKEELYSKLHRQRKVGASKVVKIESKAPTAIFMGKCALAPTNCLAFMFGLTIYKDVYKIGLKSIGRKSHNSVNVNDMNEEKKKGKEVCKTLPFYSIYAPFIRSFFS